MSLAAFIKDPAAILDYQINWAQWVGTDVITNSTWTLPPGVTLVAVGFTATTATVRVSGGTDGQDYELLNHVTLASGQQDERTIILQVRQQEFIAGVDEVDRTLALTTLNELVIPEAAPTLDSVSVVQILERNKIASTWQISTAYNIGDVILPPVRNGHRYRCIQAGTSQDTDPGVTFWPRSTAATISDGTSDPILIWQEDGPQFSNVYDIRQAAYECWDRKARIASQFFQQGDIHMEHQYEHCIEMRNGFSTLSFD